MKSVQMWFTSQELIILAQGFMHIEDDPNGTLPDNISKWENLDLVLGAIRSALDKAIGEGNEPL